MNVLVVSSRFPWPPYTGDRMRAAIWLEALAPHARVALVAPAGSMTADAPSVDFYAAAPSLRHRLRGAWRVLREGLPVQTLLAAPYAWQTAIERARREQGPFATTIVILSRSDPWMREALGDGPRLLDAIDSLRRNAEERGQAARWPWMRPFWRLEERRLARFERELGDAYDSVLVVSDAELGEFGGATSPLANSVRILPLDPAAPRRFDFGFWGRLAYFANEDAARWLIDEIIPALRALNPSATIALGGADAPRAIRDAAARAGLQLQSPIASVAEFARDVRVAIVPMRYGSGQSSKLLEASEAGCGIVTTPQALRGLPRIAPHVRVASSADAIAAAAVALLRDDAGRTSMTHSLRQSVQAHHSRDAVLAAMAQLAGVAPRKAASA